MNQKFLKCDHSTIIPRLRDGEISAFRFIFDSHYRPLYHFANQIIKDHAQSDDIIEECFITLWQKRTEFETYPGLIAFLYTCVRNACLSHLRKIKRHNTSHQEILYLSDRISTTDSAEAIKNELIQYSLIEAENLPPAMKKVFQLLYIEGFTTSEIAKKLNVSVYTVRSQKVTAIKKVKESLLKKGLLSLFL